MADHRPVLAIDPGPTESAWVLWNGEEVITHGKRQNWHFLEEIVRPYALVCQPRPQLTIEQIASYGMPVGREVFDTCVWSGRFWEAWQERTQDDPVLVPRLQVKSHLCHSAKAKDSNIRQALIDRLGAPGTKKQPGVTYGIHADEWAALALAVTVYDGWDAA